MASRQNREARDDVPTYGAPLGPPKASDEASERRARERREKLETKATPEERRKLIEKHEAAGRAETVERRRDRRTGAPKPKPGQQVTETEGKSTVEILEGRDRDIEETLTEMETGEPRPERKTDAQRRREEREREEQGGGRPGRKPIGGPVGGPTS